MVAHYVIFPLHAELLMLLVLAGFLLVGLVLGSFLAVGRQKVPVNVLVEK